jgi:putative PIN family toxin of toxin-antitoxin system
VFDTVGFVRALLGPFSVWGEVVFDFRHRYELLVSEQLIAEATDVLGRPELARRFSRLPGRDVGAVLQVLVTGKPIATTSIPRIARDPNDDYLLALASKGRALYLVTEDNDLLSLGTVNTTLIITGREFVEILRDSEHL